MRFDGDAVLLGMPDGHYDIQISGTASDLALFLWQRPVTGNQIGKRRPAALVRYVRDIDVCNRFEQFTRQVYSGPGACRFAWLVP